MSHRTIRILLLLAAACAAMLAMPASGMARDHGDRNRDRIPDRWERAHHLSLKVNQAKRDQDRDGLRNRAEFLAGTDPRNDDTDDDGTEDGAEDAGTITSFAAGVLTIHLFTGDDVKGKVDDQTEIDCESRASSLGTMRAADDGPSGGGDDQGEDSHGSGEHGSGPGDDDGEHGGGPGDDDEGDDDGQNGDGQHGDGHHGDDEGDDDGESSCDATALTAGRVVREAELKATSSGLVFRQIELVS